MKNDNFKHLLAVYGTLKHGWGNHILLQDCKLLGDQTIPGFQMYSLGGFPAINKADNGSNIKIEVYEVTDPQVLKQVYRLEGYSGQRDSPDNWYDTTEITTKWGTAEIFYFKGPITNRPLIEDGVWK